MVGQTDHGFAQLRQPTEQSVRLGEIKGCTPLRHLTSEKARSGKVGVRKAICETADLCESRSVLTPSTISLKIVDAVNVC